MLKKNVLYIPQFNMSDNNKLFITKDGAFIVQKAMLRYFREISTKLNTEWSFTILMPDASIVDDGNYVVYKKEIAKVAKQTGIKISYFPFDSHLSPILNRYDFNCIEFKKIFDLIQPAIIINNIPEITRNIRATLGSLDCKIISLHHFTDYVQENQLVDNWKNGKLFNYFYRQVDGYLSSDLNIFNCKASLDGWYESLDRVFKDEFKRQLLQVNSTYMTYVDLEDCKRKASYKFDVMTGIFPSRITDSLYTNWKTAFEMFLDPSIKGRIIFSNPSYSKGIDVVKKHYPFIIWHDEVIEDVKMLVSENNKIYLVNENMDRINYLKIAEKSHIGMNLYTSEYYGGVSQREIVATGNLMPFCPCIYEYANWFKRTDMYATFTNILPLGEMIYLYNKAVDTYGTEVHKNILEDFFKHEDYRNYIDNFRNNMLDLMEK